LKYPSQVFPEVMTISKVVFQGFPGTVTAALLSLLSLAKEWSQSFPFVMITRNKNSQGIQK